MSFHVVIPARYGSSRLPGKPLADIAGKPMVVRVVEAALRSRAGEVCVATDDERIQAAVTAHGYQAVMTRADHVSGTDRIAEVAERLGWSEQEIVVNVQGDEPLIEPVLIDQLATALADDASAVMATAAHDLLKAEDFFNPNVVKVVCNAARHALYFSRAPVPWARDAFAIDKTGLPKTLGAQRHIGIYAYRTGFLRRFGQLSPSPLEQIEALEQLRVLWHGYAIQVINSDRIPEPGVDTDEDLQRIRLKFAREQ